MQAYEWSIVTESVVLGRWALTLSIVSPFTQLVALRHAVTPLERWLARTPPWLRWVAGIPTAPPRIRRPVWGSLERAQGSAALVADAAVDALFVVPMACAWALLGGIAEIAAVTAAETASGAVGLWAPAIVFIPMNFAAFATTLVAKNRAWSSRAPFEWRLIRVVAVHHRALRRLVAANRPQEAVEDQLTLASRSVERVLWSRFPPQRRGEPSDAAASSAWAEQVSPLLSARVNRVLRSSKTPPMAWFDEWVERIAESVIDPSPATFTEASTAQLPRRRENGDVVMVITLWAVVVLAAGLAALFVGGTTNTISDLLAPVGAVAAAAIPIVTLLNLVLGAVRANRAATR